jgi:hypothetical protein
MVSSLWYKLNMNMADGFHIPIWNRTKKPFAIALSRGRDDGGSVNNIKCNSNWNCHYESPTV